MSLKYDVVSVKDVPTSSESSEIASSDFSSSCKTLLIWGIRSLCVLHTKRRAQKASWIMWVMGLTFVAR